MPKDSLAREKDDDEQARRRARRDEQEGKSPSTQAGEFVREEIHHVREGRHGARSTKQAIAIGLSKARRAGVDLPPPRPGTTSERTQESAERAYEKGQRGDSKPASPRRSRATHEALRHEPTSTASPSALSRQARTAARRRGPAERSRAARTAARTRRRSA